MHRCACDDFATICADSGHRIRSGANRPTAGRAVGHTKRSQLHMAICSAVLVFAASCALTSASSQEEHLVLRELRTIVLDTSVVVRGAVLNANGDVAYWTPRSVHVVARGDPTDRTVCQAMDLSPIGNRVSRFFLRP